MGAEKLLFALGFRRQRVFGPAQTCGNIGDNLAGSQQRHPDLLHQNVRIDLDARVVDDAADGQNGPPIRPAALEASRVDVLGDQRIDHGLGGHVPILDIDLTHIAKGSSAGRVHIGGLTGSASSQECGRGDNEDGGDKGAIHGRTEGFNRKEIQLSGVFVQLQAEITD